MKEIIGYKVIIKGLIIGAGLSAATFYATSHESIFKKIEPQPQSTTSNQLVQPFFPYTLTDSYSTQVCVSNKSGRVLPPFIVPNTK